MSAFPTRRWFRFSLRTIFVVVTVLAIALGWNAHRLRERQKLLALIQSLPELGWAYKVDPYIRAAADLQAISPTKACDTLLSIAREDEQGRRVFILCRMLFAKRKGGVFPRPFLGGTRFMGGTDYADWPLEPIELVDGVP